jgi:uncharacterized protein (DUF2249 family)
LIPAAETDSSPFAVSLTCIKAFRAPLDYLQNGMSRRVVTLDVRDEIRRGREPFSKIMAAVANLGKNEDLLLVAPFEPTPLYGVLSGQGFAHRTTPTAEGDFEVLFSRNLKPAPESASQTGPKGSACGGTPVVDLDARGLEPPQPMVKVLEAITQLPAGARLRARTDRRPMHLYAQLEQRGFRATSEEQADGSFITLIERAAPPGGNR